LWYILFWCQLLINDYFFSIDDRRYNFYNFFGFHLFCDYLIFDMRRRKSRSKTAAK